MIYWRPQFQFFLIIPSPLAIPPPLTISENVWRVSNIFLLLEFAATSFLPLANAVQESFCGVGGGLRTNERSRKWNSFAKGKGNPQGNFLFPLAIYFILFGFPQINKNTHTHDVLLCCASLSTFISSGHNSGFCRPEGGRGGYICTSTVCECGESLARSIL